MSDKRRTLLIVEDDPALQKQMRWAFDQYETVVATSFTERTEKGNFLKALSVTISEIRGVRIQKKKLRNTLLNISHKRTCNIVRPTL